MPFEYLAAGHLTHGYATTVHKSQGATVDRCLILADDSTSREHAYTALSRGRRSNDLYATAQDHRVDERHSHEQQPDPLDGLRAAIGRSGAKHLALDQVEPQPSSTLEDLRDQRRRLVEQLGPEPPDVSLDVRRVIDEKRRAEESLKDAQRRLRQAEQDLDQLGPIGRHTHRSQRRELEQRITQFTAEISQTDARVTNLDDRVAEHAPEIWERRDWRGRHATELTRLDQLDRQIDMIHRLDNVAHRSLERGLERDHGLELGL